MGSSWRSAHIHWRRRPSSLSWRGGGSRRHTRTGTGLRSPPITLPANQREVTAATLQGTHHSLPRGKKRACLPHREVSSLSSFGHRTHGEPLLGETLPEQPSRCTNTNHETPGNRGEGRVGSKAQVCGVSVVMQRVKSTECSKNCCP